MVFRGEPSARHSKFGQAACQHQVRFWEAQASVEPVTRALKYYATGSDTWGKVMWEVARRVSMSSSLWR